MHYIPHETKGATVADLEDAFAVAGAAIGEGDLEDLLPDELDPRDLLVAINQVVVAELGALDSPDEQLMTTTIEQIALRGFLAGLLVQQGQASPRGMMIAVSEETLKDLGVAAVRGEPMAFTLVASDEVD